MNKRTEILNELSVISPLIAGIDNINVFTVPAGYFETISDTVLICLNEENNLLNIDKQQETGIPAGYFDSLPTAILTRIMAQKEMAVINELKEISPVLAGINKANPFELPEQYFEQLPSVILAQSHNEETPAVLRNLQSAQPFEVPQDYFDNLAAAIVSKAGNQQSGKLVTLHKRTVFMKYAAAAAITGALALGVFKYINRPVQMLNSAATAQLEPSIEQGKNMDKTKFDETLNNLSGEDIALYLEKNGTDADIAQLISNVDENTLPRQEEYLMDNTTLDNFLQEIDTQKLEN